MRATINIDDDLLERAKSLTDITENPKLIREALEALIEREAAKRLAQLGGTEPDLTAPPRRRAATGT